MSIGWKHRHHCDCGRLHVAFYFEKAVSVRFRAVVISMLLQLAHMMTKPLEATHVSSCFTSYTWCMRWFKKPQLHTLYVCFEPPYSKQSSRGTHTRTAHDELLVWLMFLYRKMSSCPACMRYNAVVHRCLLRVSLQCERCKRKVGTINPSSVDHCVLVAGE